MQEAGLTGMLGGQQTLAGQAAQQSGQLFELQKQQINQALEAVDGAMEDLLPAIRKTWPELTEG